MIEPTVASLREIQAKWRSVILESRVREVALAVELLDAIGAGFHLNLRKPRPRSDGLIGAMVAATFNALMKSLDLAIEGYPDLSFYVSRLALEQWIGAQYIEKHPQKAERWAKQANNAPSINSMLDDLMDDPIRESYRKLQHHLNRFSHTTPTTIAVTAVEATDGAVGFRFGPNSSPEMWHHNLWLILKIGEGIIDLMHSKRAGDDPAWAERVDALRGRLELWKSFYQRQYGSAS